jgi:hypothetical protein
MAQANPNIITSRFHNPSNKALADETNLSALRTPNSDSAQNSSILGVDPIADCHRDIASKSAEPSSIAPPARTRRGFLMNSIVSAASLATATAVAAFPTGTDSTATQFDDTFARISEHRRLTLMVEEICRRMNGLEEAIPDERRRNYHIRHRGTDIGKDDDPRWTSIQQEYWTASDALRGVAWSFCDQPATSIEGMCAILAYAVEHEELGWEWPDSRHEFSSAGIWVGSIDEDWRLSLMKSLSRPVQGPDIPVEHRISLLELQARDDPIFAVIEKHQRAWDELCEKCSNLDAAHTEEADRELQRLHDAVDNASDDLLDVVPTTIKGISALLGYAADHACGGNSWPCGYEDENPKTGWDRVHGVSWEVVLHRNLAKALPKIAA